MASHKKQDISDRHLNRDKNQDDLAILAEAIMKPKRVYVLVIDESTGEAYTLDRNYQLIDKKITAKVPENYFDVWDNYSLLATPDWALDRNMTAYWMY